MKANTANIFRLRNLSLIRDGMLDELSAFPQEYNAGGGEVNLTALAEWAMAEFDATGIEDEEYFELAFEVADEYEKEPA